MVHTVAVNIWLNILPWWFMNYGWLYLLPWVTWHNKLRVTDELTYYFGYGWLYLLPWVTDDLTYYH